MSECHYTNDLSIGGKVHISNCAADGIAIKYACDKMRKFNGREPVNIKLLVNHAIRIV